LHGSQKAKSKYIQVYTGLPASVWQNNTGKQDRKWCK